MYQVGLMEADKHVQYFWNALESFSQVRQYCYKGGDTYPLYSSYYRMNLENLSSLHVTRRESHLVSHPEKEGRTPLLMSLLTL